MTPASLLNDIIAAASAMTPIATIRGYVFGSILKPDFRWTDVDILIICDDAMDAPGVRSALESICTSAPIDLLVMSLAEESELNFVSEQGCKPLFQLSA